MPSFFRIDESTRDILSALNEFRNLHAKLIDEPVTEVMTLQEMVTLLKEKPNSPEKLAEILLKVRASLPEGFETWKKPVIRIIQEGVHFRKPLHYNFHLILVILVMC